MFYVGAGKKALAKFGLIVDELEISTVTQKEIKEKITNADIIFVEGGNTFFATRVKENRYGQIADRTHQQMEIIY